MSSSPLKKSKLEKFTEEFKKSFSVPKHPRHCPDCGSKVSILNLNFKEAIFICSSTLDCVWPLGGTHQPHEILGIRDSKLQAQIRLEKTTRKKSRLFWNEGKENIPSLQEQNDTDNLKEPSVQKLSLRQNKMADHQYQVPEYIGPATPVQVQQVQYEVPQQIQPQGQVYQEMQTPQQQQQQQQQQHQQQRQPPQQEQVVYQEMQTPQQQQQRQPPQYLVIHPGQQQQQQQQPPPGPPPPQQHQYIQQQPPQQQQHYGQHPQVQQQHYVQPPQQQHVIVQHHQPRPVIHHQQVQPQQPHYVQHQQQQGPQLVQVQQGVQHPQQGPQPRIQIRLPPGQNFPQHQGQRLIIVKPNQIQRTMPMGQPGHPHPQQRPQYRMQGPRPGQVLQHGQQVQQQPGVPGGPVQHHGGPPRGPSFRLVNGQQFRPGQQIRIVNNLPPQQQLHAGPPRPNIIRYRHQPPPQQQPPPGPPHGGPDIQYNVEHVYIENGKTVRKMPVKLGDGQTIWADCVDLNQKDSNNTMVMEFDNNLNNSNDGLTQDQNNSVMNQQNRPMQQNMGTMPVNNTNKTAKDFSKDEREAIVAQVTEELISPTELAQRHGISVAAIRGWVKTAGKKLPSRYKTTAAPAPKPATPNMPPGAQPNQNLMGNNIQQPVSKEETITVYAAPGSEHCEEPPTQVVRANPAQLVVTDKQGGQTPAGQLQLPQKPHPPGLPKPVPGKAQETHTPKLIQGKVALCKNCGGYSIDISRCTGCKRPLPEGTKILPDPDYKPPVGENSKLSASAASLLAAQGDLRNIRIAPKKGRRVATSDEPECIALSSDEDEDDEDEESNNTESGSGNQENSETNNVEGASGENSKDGTSQNTSSDKNGEKETINNEPQNEFKLGPASEKDNKITTLMSDLQSLLKQEVTGQSTNLTCRSIRIGSYKTLAKEKVYFTQKAIYIRVPYLTDSKRMITLVIPATDILRIEMLPGRSMPLLFISATPSTCERVRKDLNLEKFRSQGLYYDLTCNDDTMKKITMLPEKMPDETKQLLTVFYGENITELDNKTANELLVKSTPKAQALQAQQSLHNSGTLKKASGEANKIAKYCQYPLSGKDNVSVSEEDYCTLEDESFLNDTIISFYLNWIQHKIVPEESREKTHMFTTYFYSKLTTRPPKLRNKLHPIEDNVNLTPGEKRHERVKRWTKKVNIFEKDFIIVPINEHSHWFVAVICFPGMIGKHRVDNDELIPEDPNKPMNPTVTTPKVKRQKILKIGSTSIIPINKGNSFSLDDDSDRDEADASDDDMVVEDDSHSFVDKSKEQNENEKLEEGEVKVNDESESESKTDESKNSENENSSKTEDSEEAKDDVEDGETKKEKEEENTIKKEETLKLVDGWTKSKKSRTPTPEPVSSSDPKSAEDEAMDTSDDQNENSKSELVSKDGTETETSKDSLLLDEPKQSDVKADEGKEGAEKCSDTEKTENQTTDKIKQEKLVDDAIAVKQPCILIFDSMQTGSRARVAATLREYLKCEYKHKMNEDRDFNKENMKGCCPKVPQQPNFSDCGLFLLQYVESLFKSPIKDFSLPIKSLKKWFPNQEMRNKRHDIAELIRKLAAEQHKDKKINFPQITFTPTEGSGYTDDEDDGNGSSTGTSGLGSLMTNKLLGAKTKFLVGKPNTTGTRVIHLTSSKSLSLTPTKSTTGSSLGTRGTSAAGSNNSSGPLMISRKSGKVFLSTLQNQKPKQTKTPVKSQAVLSTTSASSSSATAVTSTSSASPRKFIIPKLTKSGGGPVATAAGDNAKSVLIKNQKETSTAVSKPEKDVAENSHSTTNGPSSTTPGNTHGAASSVSTEETTSKDPNLLVNYSDSSNDNDHDDNDKDPPLFDMEVDEDGAPKLNEEVVSASSNSNFTEKTTSNVSSGNKRPAVTETEIGENDNSGVQEAKKAKLMEEQKTSTTDA